MTKKLSWISISIAVLVLSSSPLLADDLLLFSDDEAQQLSLSDHEWNEELNSSHPLQTQAEDGWIDELGDRQSDVSSGQDSPGLSSMATKGMRGPQVSIVAPTHHGDSYRSGVPIRLLVYLRSGSLPLDMDTLRVRGKRGILSVDITGRIKKFLRSPSGGEDAEYVIDGRIPKMRSGRYQIILSLADVKGNKGGLSALLEVR